MRKIFVFLSVLVILASCVVPAFALGASTTYTDRKSAVPFQYFYNQYMGGPYEYPFTCVRRGENVHVNYSTTDGRYMTCILSNRTDKSVVGQLNYPVPVSTEYHIGTFQFTNDVVDAIRANNIIFSVNTNTTDDIIYRISFYGTYVKPILDTEKEAPSMQTVSFSHSMLVRAGEFNLGACLELVRAKYGWYLVQYFESFSMDVTLLMDEEINQGVKLTINQTSDAFVTNQPTLAEWSNSKFSEIEWKLPINNDLQDFFLNTVGGFLSAPFLGESFTFGGLIALILGLALVLWFIKLIK